MYICIGFYRNELHYFRTHEEAVEFMKEKANSLSKEEFIHYRLFKLTLNNEIELSYEDLKKNSVFVEKTDDLAKNTQQEVDITRNLNEPRTFTREQLQEAVGRIKEEQEKYINHFKAGGYIIDEKMRK